MSGLVYDGAFSVGRGYAIENTRGVKLMLDVHAPEHSIGGVRDFFLHLFTITCGLLIALGLENAAEALHHRHERREAEEIIRRELEENRKDLQKGATVLAQERTSLLATLAFVEARSEAKPLSPSKEMGFAFQEVEIQDVAWRTASSTGVLSFMPYEEVEQFAEAYREQELLQTTEQRALDDFLQLSSFRSAWENPAAMSQERAKEAMPYVRRALGDLTGIFAIGQGTLEAYKEALK